MTLCFKCELYQAAKGDAEEAEAYVAELETKLFKTEGLLAKAVVALEKVRLFVRDLEPYADRGHTLVPALWEACETLATVSETHKLKGEKDE